MRVFRIFHPICRKLLEKVKEIAQKSTKKGVETLALRKEMFVGSKAFEFDDNILPALRNAYHGTWCFPNLPL